jgi:hypothetical protein
VAATAAVGRSKAARSRNDMTAYFLLVEMNVMIFVELIPVRRRILN